MEAHAEFVTITPEMATEWLGANTHNRTLKSTAVERYIEAEIRALAEALREEAQH